MTQAILLLVVVAAAVAVPLTMLVRSIGVRMSALDGAGVAGQVKVAARRVPNTGGIAIASTVLLLIGGALAVLLTPLAATVTSIVPEIGQHLPGLARESVAAVALLAGVLLLHVMGVIDDRKPLPAVPKLLVMLAIATAVVLLTRTRVLTVLDGYVGGAWLSVVITVLWLCAITNALNFLDNMDGLCGGVTVICASALLALALIHGQWFIGATLAVLIGAVLGFLVFNFPLRRPASIFMGDGGSLVCGFLLAFLSVRLTYVPVKDGPLTGPNLHAVLVPLVVLAVPLYDLTSVTLLRISQGKSPLMGDLQHLSHRLHLRGLSRRAAVVVICGLTAITAIGGVLLPSVQPWAAGLIFAQTLLALGLLAIYEWRSGAKA